VIANLDMLPNAEDLEEAKAKAEANLYTKTLEYLELLQTRTKEMAEVIHRAKLQCSTDNYYTVVTQ